MIDELRMIDCKTFHNARKKISNKFLLQTNAVTNFYYSSSSTYIVDRYWEFQYYSATKIIFLSSVISQPLYYNEEQLQTVYANRTSKKTLKQETKVLKKFYKLRSKNLIENSREK